MSDPSVTEKFGVVTPGRMLVKTFDTEAEAAAYLAEIKVEKVRVTSRPRVRALDVEIS